LSSPQSRDYTPGDYVQGDYVTYPHKYVDGAIVEVDESEISTVPPLGASTGGRKRKRREPRQVLLREEVKEKKPKRRELKPTALHKVSKTFVALYNIEALPDSLPTLEPSPPAQQERIKVSKTFTAIYHRYSLVEKSATALYQKRQLVSKSFTGLYDIKAPDYEYLDRLKRARAFADLIDVIDPE
jgi:hypothetical protein